MLNPSKHIRGASSGGGARPATRSPSSEIPGSGSEDNLSAQFVRLNAVPDPGISELGERVAGLGPPPELAPRMCFEGFSILRELHRSSRSQVMLATDDASGARVVLKLPSASLRNDPAYLEQFALEEWVQRRLQSPHLLGAPDIQRARRYLYTVTEYIEGQTLEQWMRDNPAADLETVRSIISQVARGLQAMHRQQIIHRDLRPANIMIDRHGSCRVIDFGSVLVAGIAEDAPATAHEIVGTAQYSAPEFYLGEPIGERADQFSLAVITYQLLCGALPYGNAVSRCTSRAAARRLRYRPARSVNPALPDWIDTALETALQPDALRRYEVISEFLQDLRTPSKRYMRSLQRPLIERDPLRFWQGLSLFLVLVIAFLLVSGSGLPRP